MANFYKSLEFFLNKARPDPGDFEEGEYVSQFPELKITFDNFGFDEETGENSNEVIELYTLHLHKDAAKKGFVYPENLSSSFGSEIGPEDELKIYAVFNDNQQEWDMNISESKLTTIEATKILASLLKKYKD